ncbi:MAG: 50S ribosomal protein L23 [Sphaerochaetaceae bacterium]|nr:50S ribosomal protein L23 [Sphaerochaetaceae bacterium]NLV83914.1 50S ribosomal protein L23 [Spirochaetales bacterium]HPX97665.1 50S ribosomal protein L23 [Thermotogota bacterium]
MRADQIIIEPVLTEKSNLARELQAKKYTFKVHMDANKFQIMDAIKELFEVKPVKCNVMIVKGKPKFTRTKSGHIAGTTGDWKKAVVTLENGQSIQAIEGI